MMNNWDSAGNSFIASTGLSEQSFWTQYYTLLANNLKAYPNVIFEAWNEPGDNSGGNTIPAGYMSYLTTMYNAVRSTGATNLVMMQWQPGWEPNGWGQDMSWASQINTALGGSATNMVYTTHFYYDAPTDLSSYWNNPSQFQGATSLTNCLQLLQQSMGVSAPVVINEEGSCDYSSSNTGMNTWWTNLLQAQNADGIGAGAYYWLSSSGLGGTYSSEELLTSGYTPNSMGQAYINTYVPQTTTVTTPTPTPTPATSTIVASAGTGGSISPSGTISVTDGQSQTFTIAAASGYQISDVTVNGASVGAVSTYTFSSVQSSGTITASFTATTTTPTNPTNPTSPSDPTSPTSPTAPAAETVNVTATAGMGGLISPAGTVVANVGDNVTFTIAPHSGYQISDVTINGTSVGNVTAYTFTNIQDAYTINATFTANPPLTGQPTPPVLSVNPPPFTGHDSHRHHGFSFGQQQTHHKRCHSSGFDFGQQSQGFSFNANFLLVFCRFL
jgi:hypothetical protein